MPVVMEGWLNISFISVSTLLALCLLQLLCRSNKPKKHWPPGPWKLPIIGSLHHLSIARPTRRLMELSRRHGPLMLLKLGEVPTVVVSSAELAELMLKIKDPLFADRWRSVTMDTVSCGGKGLFIAPYGDRWRQMRKICIVELLSTKQVKRMEGIRAEEIGNLLHSISTSVSTGATVNVSKKVWALSNDLVTRAVFGGKFTRQDEYMREFDQMLTLIGSCLVDLFPSSRLVRLLTNGDRLARRSCHRINRIITDTVQERKAVRGPRYSPGNEDLLDVLLRLQEEDSLAFPLTTDIISTVLFDIFGAATSTTASILEWAMSELIAHPEAMSKAQLEVRKVLGADRAVITNDDLGGLHYTQMVIKEVLRLHPPGPLLRKAREDCKIMGYDILKDTNVYVNLFAISRDPKYWENPEEFKPERFENNNLDYSGTHFEFTPFGAGRRQCPGIQFSSSVMQVVLANFLYHFDWMLPGASPVDMSESLGLVVGRKYDLELKATPHATPPK